MAFAEHYRHAIPGVRVDAAAVQEKYRRARAAPIEVMKAHRADDQLVVVRQPDCGRMKIGDLERGPEHREFFGSFHVHSAAYSRSRIFSTFAMSGSTTIVLLKFFSAVSGSFRPWPVSVHTTTEPGLSSPAPAYLSSPATDAADAGSANTPPLAISRYAARISESVTMSIIPPDSSRALVAPFQLAGLPILIAVATVCGSSIGWPTTIGADSAA